MGLKNASDKEKKQEEEEKNDVYLKSVRS